MSQLINIAGNWIDPTRVVSVVKPSDESDADWFFIHVDMGGWTAGYRIPEEDEEYGWAVDSAAAKINEARR